MHGVWNCARRNAGHVCVVPMHFSVRNFFSTSPTSASHASFSVT